MGTQCSSLTTDQPSVVIRSFHFSSATRVARLFLEGGPLAGLNAHVDFGTLERDVISNAFRDVPVRKKPDLLIVVHKCGDARIPLTDEKGRGMGYHRALQNNIHTAAEVVLLLVLEMDPKNMKQLLREQPTLVGLMRKGRFLAVSNTHTTTERETSISLQPPEGDRETRGKVSASDAPPSAGSITGGLGVVSSLFEEMDEKAKEDDRDGGDGDRTPAYPPKPSAVKRPSSTDPLQQSVEDKAGKEKDEKEKESQSREQQKKRKEVRDSLFSTDKYFDKSLPEYVAQHIRLCLERRMPPCASLPAPLKPLDIVVAVSPTSSDASSASRPAQRQTSLADIKWSKLEAKEWGEVFTAAVSPVDSGKKKRRQLGGGKANQFVCEVQKMVTLSVPQESWWFQSPSYEGLLQIRLDPFLVLSAGGDGKEDETAGGGGGKKKGAIEAWSVFRHIGNLFGFDKRLVALAAGESLRVAVTEKDKEKKLEGKGGGLGGGKAKLAGLRSRDSGREMEIEFPLDGSSGERNGAALRFLKKIGDDDLGGSGAYLGHLSFAS
uniref:Uncharacterized protein n=1 Tax=Chromera velia CCMP2878 TaxID=1169474 RepID=A0A0G4FDI2_9ALVE|eukprot:Cvel_16328.t1-p1 / transcript=Cvel_16328.t1 / gene=Cvel_16328 / organism=Chromera_velia_CCMP2878 / gene_product=hypothetical protein / transcript_product=hypothetical protein / location=Cvel_scaffold1253:13574-19696(-) / protein_length=547 / sequence_SO=supercontig / SO=protein_coding / is_pseudo=false